MDAEKIDLNNIIEIEKIRKILKPNPDLLNLFEILIIICNSRVNQEKSVAMMPIEKNIEPDLSDHSSDEEST